MADSARVYHGGSDVVDQLLFDQLFAIPNAVEYFPHGKRRGGVLTNEAERSLVVRRNGIFQPEQAVGLQSFTQLCRLDRRQPMMRVMEQVDVPTERRAGRLEQLRCRGQILARRPA